MMMKILKQEYERAVHGIGMLISMGIGLGCILFQVIPIINKWIESAKVWEEQDMYITFTRGGFFNFWLPSYMNGSTLYYYYFLGIIVALPYGVSYYRDKKSGVIKNICNRIEKSKYLIAKYIATFLAGGIAASLPLIFDFMLVKLIIPVDNFDINGTVLNAITEWGAFTIDNPYLAVVLILLAWFFWGGALATVSLMVSSISDNFFTIQLTPFFLMMILFYLPSFLPVEDNIYFPFYFLTMFGGSNPLLGMGEAVLLMVITFSAFIGLESKRDIF